LKTSAAGSTIPTKSIASSPPCPVPSSPGRRRGSGGSGTGKTTLLYKAFKEVNKGSYIDYPAQTIGDCVSHGFGHGVDLLGAVQIALGHKNEVFHQTATEAIYGWPASTSAASEARSPMVP